jgi:hypothetical protein
LRGTAATTVVLILAVYLGLAGSAQGAGKPAATPGAPPAPAEPPAIAMVGARKVYRP